MLCFKTLTDAYVAAGIVLEVPDLNAVDRNP
jgi:hypothetical protein